MKNQKPLLRKISLIILFVAMFTPAFAQNNFGELRGKIMDKKTKEPLEFATIVLQQEGIILSSTTSNENGVYYFKNLSPGEYSLTATFFGFKKYIAEGVLVSINTIRFWNIKLESIGDNGLEIQEIKVRSSQQELINLDQNRRTYRPNKRHHSYASPYPQENTSKKTNVNRTGESYSKITETGYKNPYSNPLSTFSIDVDKASYSITRSYLQGNQLPPPDAVRIEEMINYFDYNYPEPTEGELLAMHSEMGTCPWNEKHLLLKIGINAKKLDRKSLEGSNLVFLIDVSGSMESEDKLPLVKKSLLLLLDQLDARDKVALVVYAGSSGLVLPSTPCSDKKTIKKAIETLSSGGSTAGGEGIVLAYKIAQNSFIKGGINRVILATDGDFNVGLTTEKELEDLIVEKRKSNIFLTVLGFGQGNYIDSKMETLADKGNGNYAYIDNIREAQKILVKEMMETTLNVAKDVKIQIEFNPLFVKSYRLIGYENRALADEDFKDDTKDAGEMGSGSSVTAFYEIIPKSMNPENSEATDSFRYRNFETIKKLYHQELGFLKLRYKSGDNPQSQMLNMPISRQLSEHVSDDFNFAASVVQMGLILRNSEYKGFSNYHTAIKMAKQSKGEDSDGEKKEFISMLTMAKTLSRR